MQFLRQPILAQPELVEELLKQHLAGMYGWEQICARFLSHAAMLLWLQRVEHQSRAQLRVEEGGLLRHTFALVGERHYLFDAHGV